MKKHLLTCFLLPLMIGIGSPSSAWSKVAESPPAGEFQSPAFLRGGDARPDTFEKSSEQGMIYLEIASTHPPDTLWITYWEHLLSDTPAVTPGREIPIQGQKGTFFEGSSGSKVFAWELPDLDRGYVSISDGKTELIHQWAFWKGDRLRMRIDLERGSTLFGGPQAEFYKTQYLLDRQFQEEKFNSSPILMAPSIEALDSDPVFQQAYQKAKAQASDIRLSLKILAPEENGWAHLTESIQNPMTHHPAWNILRQADPNLTAQQKALLSSRIWGGILSVSTQRAESLVGQLQADSAKAAEFFRWSDQLKQEEKLETSHPLLVQSLTKLEIIRSKISGEEVLSLLQTYPDDIRDELLGYFILSNYNRLQGKLESYLLASLRTVETPWIRERLEGLADTQLGTFVSEGLFDAEGNSVNLGAFEGKTVLLHFWISGCKFCRDDFQRVLQPLQDLVAGREDIILVTVNADGREDTWKSSLASDQYTTAQFLNLRAEKGAGILERYSIHSFPQKIILRPDHRIKLQSLDRMEAQALLDCLSTSADQSSLAFSFTINPNNP